ncbi:hypothetical protein NKDENANG_02379 [Candidatus Entotheonellaceae bacterium PAL068K]
MRVSWVWRDLATVFALPFTHTQPGTLEFMAQCRLEARGFIRFFDSSFHEPDLIHDRKFHLCQARCEAMALYRGDTGLAGHAP